MMEKFYLFGNWKMHKSIEESVSYAHCIKNEIKDEAVIVGIFPPFTAIDRVSQILEGSNISVGAQNMHFEEQGAFTGEISPLMLKELGVKYVLIGHSERRHIFGECDEIINKKMISALLHGITPILCVGETLKEREEEKTEIVIKEQLERDLRDVKNKNFIIAYEPVWAIGTGKNATPSQAGEVHRFVRKELVRIFGDESLIDTPILYGGSIKVDNFSELSQEKEIDGGLVGGASLDCFTFLKLYEILRSQKMKK